MADHRYAVGSFARRTSVGTQTVSGISDALGDFTGKGILLFGSVQVGTTEDDACWFFAGLSDGTRGYTMSFFAQTGQSAPSIDWARVQTNINCPISINNETQTVTSYVTGLVGATVPVQFGLGTFTIEWVAQADANPFDVHYIVFGGTDLAIVAGSQADPRTTGLQTFTTPVGIGQLTGLIALSVPGREFLNYSQPVILNTAWPNIGFTDGTNQASIATSTAVEESHYSQQSDRLLHRISSGIGVTETAASIVSLGVGQFTVDYSAADATGGPFGGFPEPYPAGFFYLAIAGPQCQVGVANSPVTPGPGDVSLPFTPGAALLASCGNPASVALEGPMRFSLGAAAPLSQATCWIGSLDGTTSVRARRQSEADCLIMADPDDPTGSTLIAQASASVGVNTLELDWNAADSTDREFLYMAFGPASVTPEPPVYTVERSPIRWCRRGPTVQADGKRLFFGRFQLDMNVGSGIPGGQGENPIVYVRTSDDGGYTWSSFRQMTTGRMGQYLVQAKLYQNGSAYQRVFEVSGSDPVALCLVQAFLDVEGGDH